MMCSFANQEQGLVAALDPKLAVGVGETHNGSDNWGASLTTVKSVQKPGHLRCRVVTLKGFGKCLRS
jgi:hypothetical protein